MGIAHVTVVVEDVAAALAFYDATLFPLGLARGSEYPDEEDADLGVEAAGYGDPAVFWVVSGKVPTRGAHIAFDVEGSDPVRRFHAAGLAAGGSSHRAPRRWEIYPTGYFGAIVADPQGNLLEAVGCEEPQTSVKCSTDGGPSK